MQENDSGMFSSVRTFFSQMLGGVGIEMPEEILTTLQTRSASEAISCSNLVGRAQTVDHVLQNFEPFVEGCIGFIHSFQGVSIPEEYAKQLVHVLIFISVSVADKICKDILGQAFKTLCKGFINKL